MQYYNLLRAQALSEALAVRVVGDWITSRAVSTANYFDGGMRQAERSVSDRIARPTARVGRGQRLTAARRHYYVQALREADCAYPACGDRRAVEADMPVLQSDFLSLPDRARPDYYAAS